MENRRTFIKQSTALAAFSLISDWAAASPAEDKWGKILPQRQLTRDGQKVTALCLGGYHMGFTEDAKTAEHMLERAMRLGRAFL